MNNVVKLSFRWCGVVRQVAHFACRVSALILCPVVLAAQGTTLWIGKSESRGVSKPFTICAPQCSSAVAQAPARQSFEIGVERRIRESKYASLSLGASLARRGWLLDVTGPDELFLGIPMLAIVEPLGRGSPFGVAVAGGVSGDVSLERMSNSRSSLIASSWLSWYFSADRALVLGGRWSRAMRPHDLLYLRSRSIFVGVDTR